VTRRELDVLGLVAQRLTNAEIAGRLRVSERTVETHVSSLLHKLRAHNRIELARRAAECGPLQPSELPQQLRRIAQGGECVGRDEELQRLLGLWDRAATHTTVAVVSGEAGIGKSRLAAGVASDVHDRGGRVALGTCSDVGQGPYEPLLAPIAGVVAGLSSEQLHTELGEGASAFARILPEIATRLGVAALDVVDPERERAAVQAALHDYLVQLARTGPLLFVLEDLHWASAGTRETIAHLARTGSDAPLMLLVTTRDEPPFADCEYEAYLGRLSAFPSVEVVELSGLDVTAAATVISAVGGDLDPTDAVRQTAGNPLFLRELAREGPVSRSLRRIVADRFEQLCSHDLDVLDVAAVAGERIDVGLVAEALDRSSADVLDSLERAESGGLIVPGVQPGRFEFQHDVFRAVRYGTLTATRRLRLHAAVARALSCRRPYGRSLAQLARHACLAGPCFDPAVAADLARLAGDAASDATDHGEAAAHYRRALDALDLALGADDDLRLRLSMRLGAALALIGDPHGQTLLRTVAHTARERGDAIALAEAVCAMAWVPGGSVTFRRADPRVMSLAESALAALPSDAAAWRIRIMTLIGMQLLLNGAPGRGTEMIREAVGAARRLGDEVTLGRALLSFRFCGGPLEMEERVACGHELIELGDRTGHEVFGSVGRQQLWWCYRELGERPEMDRWYDSAAQRIRGQDIEQLSQLPALALLDGDLDRAEHMAGMVIKVWGPSGVGRTYMDPLRAFLEECRGHPPDLYTLKRMLDRDAIPPDLVEPYVARASALTGDQWNARTLLDQATRRGFAPMYAALGGASLLSCWAEAAALVEHVPAASELGRLLEPLAGRLVDNGSFVSDTIDRIRALLRLTVGNPADAAEIAAAAVAASRRRQTPLFLGRELIILAAARQRVGAATEECDRAINEALAIGLRLGARIIAQDAQRLLPGTATQLPDRLRLTAREREMIDLVATGATNAQIATELGISASTVRKHLEHAYAKLEVSTRTAAVARAIDTRETQPRRES
jgi:DNA-binding NarL/FixJ family response regulator